MDDFYLRRSLIEADYISQKVYYISITCVSVELCGWHGAVCVTAFRCLRKKIKERKSWKTGYDITCVFLSSRLPEPRAEPMNPRDFEDNDSGPSMDHAPWYKKIRLLLRPPVLHCLLQPAISSLELSGWPSLCQPSPWVLALPFQCLLAVKWPWRKLLWQIWIATSFLLKLF